MHYLVTPNGHGFFEATSAFQKAIRRGDEKVALYFMVEFFNGGYDEYLWRRMKIIVSEDIGLAEPNMCVQLNTLYQFYSEKKKEEAAKEKESKKNGRGERMFLVHAVLMMVRAKKSRLIDWAVMKSWRDHDVMEIPDYAYDMHNQKGKAMGRGVDHFFKEGSHLENHDKQPGEDQMKKDAYKARMKNPGKLNFYKEGGSRQHTMNFENEEE